MVVPRRRLTPEARREQLLETARLMIVEQGLQSFTMDALAKSAGVTTPLVYNYFTNRQMLLQSLLLAEYTRFQDELMAAVSASESFEEMVRAYVTSNFDHHAPGSILPILQSQPEIVSVISERLQSDGQQTARHVVQQTARRFTLTRSQAELVASMSSGASIAAAQYAANAGLNRERTIEQVISYVLAGIRVIAAPGADHG